MINNKKFKQLFGLSIRKEEEHLSQSHCNLALAIQKVTEDVMIKLTKSLKGMDNYDMLNLQLDTAKRKVEFAIQKRVSKIVFIHGVGEGVLKSELQSLLNKYPVKHYDASYKKYGLGATEVYFFQNTVS